MTTATRVDTAMLRLTSAAPARAWTRCVLTPSTPSRAHASMDSLEPTVTSASTNALQVRFVATALASTVPIRIRVRACLALLVNGA